MKKFILLLILVATTSITFAQRGKETKVADNTYMRINGKSVTIETSDNATRERLLKTNYTRMSVTKKKDRNGEYTNYSFNYKPESVPAEFSKLAKQ